MIGCSRMWGGGGRKIASAALSILSAWIIVGCGEPEANSPEPVAPQIAFEGKVDPSYAGIWITADKTSTLELSKDGKANMTNVAVGRGTSKAAGEWKISDKNLLFKVEGPESYVSRYAAELKGDILHLKQKASKLDVEYKRSK
ncbi:MAG: hypothetical protein BGO01_19755 [Armatimonadetes bacterium 55-13]|nr:hypothetical protein [Armatimonadota bacterium]OJU64348.1 MAG: hypothetical protein BGO01_19755 [Armatimonadetes bacterium 55-13]